MIARMAKKKVLRGVTNEKIMEVLLDMGKRVEGVESLMEIQVRRSSRLDTGMSRVGSKITRFETLVEKTVVEFTDRLNEMEGALKSVVEWGAMKSDLKDFATKNDLERIKDEILKPVIKTVDKDAEMLINHGKRIAVLERRSGLVTK